MSLKADPGLVGQQSARQPVGRVLRWEGTPGSRDSKRVDLNRVRMRFLDEILQRIKIQGRTE